MRTRTDFYETRFFYFDSRVCGSWRHRRTVFKITKLYGFNTLWILFEITPQYIVYYTPLLGTKTYDDSTCDEYDLFDPMEFSCICEIDVRNAFVHQYALGRLVMREKNNLAGNFYQFLHTHTTAVRTQLSSLCSKSDVVSISTNFREKNVIPSW